MKNFFKDKYNLALICIVSILIVCIIFAQFWDIFVTISVFVLSILCFYISWFVYHKYKLSKQRENINDFFPDQTLEERKKATFLENENKVNRMLFIYGFLIFGVCLLYLFIKMI